MDCAACEVDVLNRMCQEGFKRWMSKDGDRDIQV